MKSYLKELNEVQRQAVTNINGPVLVIAGPGSGKTRVLTYRIAHLIEEGVAPWEILALTFTNKAAREMKERISNVVGDKANRVWAGTFHSIFARILRVEADKIGYPSNFTIYDSDDSRSLINAIIKELNLDKAVYNANSVRSRISSAKSNIIGPKAYKADEELMQQDRMSKRPHLHNIYEKYVIRCKRSGAMDFDDLLYQLYILLYKNPDNVLEKYQQRFKYILVDEFQDTNYLQNTIVKKLVKYENSAENICVVGDDAQSIYAFRGATIDNILNFEKEYKNLQTFKLEQNYRSTDHIVQAANEIILKNKKQIQKKIWSDKGDGQKIKVIKAMTDSEEGKRVADTIVEQKTRYHLKSAEIAILYRTNAQSRVFEEYLRRHNIQYKIFGGQSFYQRKEIKDLIAYMRLAINPNDEEALRRVVNFPKRGIGATTIEKISTIAGETDRSMWECLGEVQASARAKKSLGDFKLMIKVFIEKAKTSNAFELASYIAKQTTLLDLYKQDTTIEGMNRVENLNALLDGIKDFVENDEVIEGVEDTDKSLAAYLQNIALLTDFDENSNDGDYVTLMSIHSAKGLEFKSIFVVGLEEKLFPSFMSMDSMEGLDEERRLFYVAITRAEQFLTLTYAGSRYRYGKMQYNEPSRFLDEIDYDHLDATFSIRRKTETAPAGAKVMGNFKPLKTAMNSTLHADPATFKPNASGDIQAGMKILHLKFGKGKVLSIDGSVENRVATIFFKGIDTPERRIMLKYAKLQILD
jgi:ATP-dependent DNA helicase UvrD/PcrA